MWVDTKAAALADLVDGRFRPHRVSPVDPRQLELFKDLPLIPWATSASLVSESWRRSARPNRPSQPPPKACVPEPLKLAA
jgi:hypothetical protein